MPPVSGADRRVLVVEDEYFIAEEIVAALRRAGAQIAGPVATVEDAMRLLDGISLAVLDINLRGKISFDLARTLRALDIPFIFATGYGEADLPPDQRDVPLWGKPFDAAALAAALMELEEAKRQPSSEPARSAG